MYIYIGMLIDFVGVWKFPAGTGGNGVCGVFVGGYIHVSQIRKRNMGFGRVD